MLWEFSVVSSLSSYIILVQHACNDRAWLTSESSPIIRSKSPKGFFWQIIRIFYFFSLANHSRYLQSLALKDWSLGKQLILFPSNLILSLGILGNKINCLPQDQSLIVYCLNYCYELMCKQQRLKLESQGKKKNRKRVMRAEGKPDIAFSTQLPSHLLLHPLLSSLKLTRTLNH